MIFRHEKERHVPVDTAEKGEIGRHRRNPLVMGIVHLDTETVRAVMYQGADIEGKCRIAALVVAGIDSVHPEVRFLIGPLKAHEHHFAGEVVVDRERFLVPARTPPVAGLVVGAVNGVPSMRKRHLLRNGTALLTERPAVVDGPDVALRRDGQAQQEEKESRQAPRTNLSHFFRFLCALPVPRCAGGPCRDCSGSPPPHPGRSRNCHPSGGSCTSPRRYGRCGIRG